MQPVGERPIEQLTLRELFTDAEMLIRELTEHLEQSFQPRIRAVEEVVRNSNKSEERRQIADSSVRSRTAALLGSDDFSQQLLTRLEQFLVAIEAKADEAVQNR